MASNAFAVAIAKSRHCALRSVCGRTCQVCSRALGGHLRSGREDVGLDGDIEFRAEIFNLFDTVNFANPIGTLPQAIPTAALSEANRLQPGQPYTAAAAGTFGRLSSTVGRTVGLGTPRQVQLAVRFQF